MAYDNGQWAEKRLPSYKFRNLIEVIKMIRSFTDLGLKEAKELAEVLEIVTLVPQDQYAAMVLKAKGRGIDLAPEQLRRGVDGSVELLRQFQDGLL